jgi:PAS domain S-box-containing protein
MMTLQLDFRSLFESAPGLYLILLPDLTIATMSDAYAIATMTNRDSIVGKKLFDVFPDNPNDPSADGVSNLKASLDFVLKNRTAHTMAVQKYDIKRPDGAFEVRYWSPLNKPVLNTENEIAYIIHRVEDVTEFISVKNEEIKSKKLTADLYTKLEKMEIEIILRSKEIQQMNADLEKKIVNRTNELAKNEKLFRALVENEYSITLLLNEKLETIYRSPSAEITLGWSAQEREKGKPDDLIHPDELEYQRDLMKEVFIKPGKPIPIALRAKHKKGHYVWLEGVFTNKLSDPNINGIVMNLRDITEKKAAEEKLKEKIREISDYKFSLDESSIVAITDHRGIIQHVNDNFCTISKFSKDELIGQDHRIINSGYHSKEFMKNLWSTITKGEIWKGEIKNRAKDGSYYWVDTTIVPFLDENKKPYQYIAIRSDISEKKRAESALVIQNKKLQNQNKELEQYTYITSHDLQEPLRTLISFSELIQEEFSEQLEGDFIKYVGFIQQSAERMRNLVKALLDYSRIGKEKELTTINCNKTIDDVLSDMAANITESNAKIFVSELPELTGYSTDLRLLFQNLISNALKFRKKDINPEIKISVKRKNEYWQFSVQDNGIGIEENSLKDIFTIFKRLHNQNDYEGTGIGLAHCKKIVELHDGEIWGESEMGVGSVIHFTIKIIKNL